MREIERLLTAASITIEPVDPPTARGVLPARVLRRARSPVRHRLRSGRELAVRSGRDAASGRALPGRHAPRRPVCCGALKFHGDDADRAEADVGVAVGAWTGPRTQAVRRARAPGRRAGQPHHSARDQPIAGGGDRDVSRRAATARSRHSTTSRTATTGSRSISRSGAGGGSARSLACSVRSWTPNFMPCGRRPSDCTARRAAGDGRQLDEPAYPSEWSIADVLSHIGSGAVIMQRRARRRLGRPRSCQTTSRRPCGTSGTRSRRRTEGRDGLVADRA